MELTSCFDSATKNVNIVSNQDSNNARKCVLFKNRKQNFDNLAIFLFAFVDTHKTSVFTRITENKLRKALVQMNSSW